MPSGIRGCLEEHRREALALLERMAITAKAHPSSELAGAISNLARTHHLLAEELDFLSDEGEFDRENARVAPETNETVFVHSSRRLS